MSCRQLTPLYSRRTDHTSQKTCHVPDCVVIGPLPSTGHGADHIENATSVVLYNPTARATAEYRLSVNLCDVTAYARICLARVAYKRSVRGPQKTLLIYRRECMFIGPLPSSGSIRHNTIILPFKASWRAWRRLGAHRLIATGLMSSFLNV
jgi:hypothetical protein